MKTCPYAVLPAVLLVGIALSACDRPSEASDDAAPPAAIGEPAAQTPATDPPKSATAVPALHVTTLDGDDYDLADHRGTWVVINFWATWCAPCLKEMPELSVLDAMHEHIEVIGLAYEQIEPEAMRAFLAEHPVVYPIAIVDTYAPPADFDTPRGLPMTWLIAPDGRVAKKILGPVTTGRIEAAIAAAGGPDPEDLGPTSKPAGDAETT